MRSLSADLEGPGVSAFLTAVDQVMNSNTFLLKVRADAPVTCGNRGEVLDGFLRSPLFREMMLAADEQRGLLTFNDIAGDAAGADSAEPNDSGPWLVRADARPVLVPMKGADFLARLRWMLCASFSPYRRHLPEVHAEELVTAFADDALGGGSRATVDRRRGLAPAFPWGWSFASVVPDFLSSTEYYTGKPSPDPAYFDGGPSDTATFFHREGSFFLLLTNGSP